MAWDEALGDWSCIGLLEHLHYPSSFPPLYLLVHYIKYRIAKNWIESWVTNLQLLRTSDFFCSWTVVICISTVQAKGIHKTLYSGDLCNIKICLSPCSRRCIRLVCNAYLPTWTSSVSPPLFLLEWIYLESLLILYSILVSIKRVFFCSFILLFSYFWNFGMVIQMVPPFSL